MKGLSRKLNFRPEHEMGLRLFCRMDKALLNSLKTGGGSLWWIVKPQRASDRLYSYIFMTLADRVALPLQKPTP